MFSKKNEPQQPAKMGVADSNSRKTGPIIALFSALVLVAGGVVGYYALAGNMTKKDTNIQTPVSQQRSTLGAELALVEGTVQLSKDGKSWQDARSGQSIANADRVRTLGGARAIVVLDTGSIVRLDGDTEVHFSALGNTSTEVTLQKGQTYSRVVKSDTHPFTVKTANDQYKALGTAYKTATDGKKDTLEVYQSKVEVLSKKLSIVEGKKYDTETKKASDIDREKLKKDAFAQWNKQKDAKKAAFKEKLGILREQKKAAIEQKKEEKPQQNTAPRTPSYTPRGALYLSASPTKDGVFLKWSTSNAALSEGYKIVRSKQSASPTFGVHEARYIGQNATKSYLWYDKSGATHFYRICVYNAGKCSSYSNAVKITSPKYEKKKAYDKPKSTKAPVVSGSISLQVNGNTASWRLNGGNAPHGFKVVMSKSQNPTYPNDSPQYIGDGNARSTMLYPKEAGTYYVRVCKYTAGTQQSGCVDYSNQAVLVKR